MTMDTENNVTVQKKPRVYISGAGVLHVRSSEILRSKEGMRQLDAMSKIKIKKKQVA